MTESARYYVDPAHGNDGSIGTSPTEAWRSLERVSQARLRAGDRVLFAGGRLHRGSLRLSRISGTDSGPIVFASYGRGYARIDAGDGDGIVLFDCSHVVVEKLTIAGSGRKSGNDGIGVRLLRTRSVELRDLEVSGFRLGGIFVSADERTRILRVHARDNGAAGIEAHSGREGMARTRDLYIGHCLAENNAGDPKNLTGHSGNGIVVGGADRVLIEYCEAKNNGWDMPRTGNGPVGIWGWNCDRLVIQSCISHHNRSPGLDGGGFDFDGGVTNSVMQYNLSYENGGCGYLLCQYPGARPWKNNVVRYNISVNDGATHFQSGIGLWRGDSGIEGALIHNNTIVNPSHAVRSYGDIPGLVFRNNIFMAGGDVVTGDFDGSSFENNLYWMSPGNSVFKSETARFASLREWAEATGKEQIGKKLAGLFADPRLVMPPSMRELPADPRTLQVMPYYRLLPDSPCRKAGKALSDRGKRDFFGNPTARARPSIGAHEAP